MSAVCHAQQYLPNIPADHPAIHYATGDSLEDPVARLIRSKAHLAFREGGLGYLPDLLSKLGVNVDSQALVFSKTSVQANKISPRNPRAIYFNDEVAVGFVRGATSMEIAAADPKQGIVFYTVEGDGTSEPVIARHQDCLHCHQGAATQGVPGVFIGSVFPGPTGLPNRSQAIITDHRTPFADRWGGWYVTAKSGEQPDRANSVAPDPDQPEVLEREGMQNLTSLVRKFDVSGYLASTSDIVALMTFEHQTQMMNWITRIGWDVRTGANADSDADALVRYMLFEDEAPLKAPVEGVSTFTQTFPRRGPRDSQGRSLRDFDLQTRLFRYPLSYMIYSAPFNALPPAALERIYRRLYDVLSGPRGNAAILSILRETKPDLPSYWREAAKP